MRVVKFINNILFKQYELRIEDYLFNKNTQEHCILFKLKFSRCKLKVKLSDVVNNENYLKKIHPYDCYIIGILSNLIFNNMIPKNKTILKLQHNNEKIRPCLYFTGIDYKNNKLTLLFKNSLSFEIPNK
jgi:hypothetical protein